MGAASSGWWKCQHKPSREQSVGGACEEKVLTETALLDGGVHGDGTVSVGRSGGRVTAKTMQALQGLRIRIITLTTEARERATVTVTSGSRTRSLLHVGTIGLAPSRHLSLPWPGPSPPAGLRTSPNIHVLECPFSWAPELTVCTNIDLGAD